MGGGGLREFFRLLRSNASKSLHALILLGVSKPFHLVSVAYSSSVNLLLRCAQPTRGHGMRGVVSLSPCGNIHQAESVKVLQTVPYLRSFSLTDNPLCYPLMSAMVPVDEEEDPREVVASDDPNQPPLVRPPRAEAHAPDVAGHQRSLRCKVSECARACTSVYLPLFVCLGTWICQRRTAPQEL